MFKAVKAVKAVKAIAITVAIATSAVATTANADLLDFLGTNEVEANTYNLRMVTAFPKNSPGHGASSVRFADNVRALSDGRIDIKVFASGELVPMKEAFATVSNGKADMYHGIEMFWPGVDPALNYFATIPFGMTPTEHLAWVEHGGGQALWDEAAAQYNIKPFALGNSATSMGGWYNKEINTTDDIAGMHLRFPGLGAKVMQKYGASTTVVSGSKILPGLLDGTFDGAELAGPWYDNAMGLYKSPAKHYYAPGWHELSTILSLGFNAEVWNDFSDKDKNLIVTAVKAEQQVQFLENFYHHSVSLQKMYDEDNITVKHFPQPVLDAFKKTAYELIDEKNADSELAQRTHNSYFGFMKAGKLYSENGILPYMNSRDTAN